MLFKSQGLKAAQVGLVRPAPSGAATSWGATTTGVGKECCLERLQIAIQGVGH